GDGGDENDGGNVVEDCGEERGYPQELDYDEAGVTLRLLGNGDGEPFEEAGFGEDAHDDHHPHEEEEDVHVHTFHGYIVGHEMEEDDERGAGQGRGRFVDDFEGDKNIHDQKD